MSENLRHAVIDHLLSFVFRHPSGDDFLIQNHIPGSPLAADDLVGACFLEGSSTNQMLGDSLVGRQRFIHTLNDLFHSLLHIGNAVHGHILGIGINLCGDQMVIAVHQTFLHQLMVQQQVFDLLRCNIFAVGQNDQVLDTAGDIDEALIVHIAHITGSQPPVRCDDLRSQFRGVDIAHHHGGALHLNFPVYNTHFTASYQHTAAVSLVGTGPARNGNTGRTLRHTVTLGDPNADVLIFVNQLRGQMSTAGNDLIDSLAEDQILALLHGLARLLTEHKDLVIQRIGDHGNHTQASGLIGLQCLAQLVHAVVEADGGADAQRGQEVRLHAECVMHRQNADLDVDIKITVECGVDQVCVRKHDTLFFTGGTGGEDNGGAALLINGVIRFTAFIGRKNAAAGFRSIILSHPEGLGNVLAAGADLIDIQCQLRLPDQNVRFRLIQASADHIHCGLRIQIHGGTAAGHDAQHHACVQGVVGADHRDPCLVTQIFTLLSRPCGDGITFQRKLTESGVMDHIIPECAQINTVFISFSGFCHQISDRFDRFKSHHMGSPLQKITHETEKHAMYQIRLICTVS